MNIDKRNAYLSGIDAAAQLAADKARKDVYSAAASKLDLYDSLVEARLEAVLGLIYEAKVTTPNNGYSYHLQQLIKLRDSIENEVESYTP